MQFGMLSRAGPGNMYYMAWKCKCPHGNGHFLGVSGRLKSIVKHRTLGVCYKRVSCAKTDGPILTIYTSHDMFLRKELPLGSCNDCTCVKTFSDVNFL